MFTVTDNLSACAFKLLLKYRGESLAVGTGFLLTHNAATYLVTARHNLTGRNAYSGAPLSSRMPARYPNELEFSLPYEANVDSAMGFDTQPCELELWDDGEPIWKVYDPDDLTLDVAVIDLTDVCSTKRFRSTTDSTPREQTNFLSDTTQLAKGEYFVVSNGNRLRLASISHYTTEGFPLRVGDDVFILGFPRGIEVGGRLPIWKRGTLASEPLIPIDDLPFVLVDSATRQGMSGGPVVARQQRGSAILPGGVLSLLAGEVTRFVGVYTSRDTGDELDAQLGRVWSKEHVFSIVERQRRDKARI